MRWLPVFLSLATAPSGMVEVSAGPFTMGSDFGEADERPAHTVTLAAFYLDRDEVTVGDYRRCVTAGICAAPSSPLSSNDGDPVVWVRWSDADTYCRSVGKRLPTEAEWEKAARGTDGRRFPWGNDVDCARANFGSYRGEGRCPDAPGRPRAVAAAPATGASPYGARDLAGNVWEWVADRYDATYYAHSPRRDPPGPASSRVSSRGGASAPPFSDERRVLRGGACCSMLGLPRAANRLAFPADYRDDDIGFRCARSKPDTD